MTKNLIDPESCSRCVVEVEDDTLTENWQGERLCLMCVRQDFIRQDERVAEIAREERIYRQVLASERAFDDYGWIADNDH